MAELLVHGITINSSDTEALYAYSVDYTQETSLYFTDNSIGWVTHVGYGLLAGTEGSTAYNNNLDNAVITGNKFVWNDTCTNFITHGIFTGYNIDIVERYNYLDNVPYGFVIKSGTIDGTSMTYTADSSGGVAYNIIKDSGKFGIILKGMSGVRIYNNTFYNSNPMWTQITVSPNEDWEGYSPSQNTKIFNNIFYAEVSTCVIKVWSLYDCEVGFESDYNIFYCPNGSNNLLFDELGYREHGNYLTFAQWQALGYDTHSKIIDPSFIDKDNFVPSVPLYDGSILGERWKTGLSINATWDVSISPETQNQGSSWQVGARIYGESSTYYVAVDGSDNWPGTYTQPWANWEKCSDVSLNPGDTIYIRGGIYTNWKVPTSTTFQCHWHHLSGTADNMIKIWAYPGEEPIWDLSSRTLNWLPWIVQMNHCSYVHVKGLKIRNGRQPSWWSLFGWNIMNSSNCIIENCSIDHFGGYGFLLGCEIYDTINTEYSYNNLYLNCDAWMCEDPSSPSPYGGANGFNMFWNTSVNVWGPNTTYRGCRAWYNSDDGWDFFGNDSTPIRLENCWSMFNGYSENGMHTGDGQGYKLGPSGGPTGHDMSDSSMFTLTNCLAVGNYDAGFDQNTTSYWTSSSMQFYNCFAYKNNFGFEFYDISIDPIQILRNNISYDNTGANITGYLAKVVHDHNSWDSSVTINDNDFISLDVSQLLRPRKANGDLPDVSFGHLITGSDLIWAGIYVANACTYDGEGNIWHNPPSIGAYEYDSSIDTSTYYVDPSGNDLTGTGTINFPWASLHKACSSVNASGSIIHVNAGTYVETSTCNVALGVSIEGNHNPLPIIICTYETSIFYDGTIKLLSSSEGTLGNQSISYLQLDGSNWAGSSCITIRGRSYVTVHDCSITNFDYNAVYFGGWTGVDWGFTRIPSVYSSHNELYNCNIIDCGNINFWETWVFPHTSHGGIRLGGQEGFLMHDNILKNTGRPDGFNGDIVDAIEGSNKGLKYYNNKSYKNTHDASSPWNFHFESWNCEGGHEFYNNEMYGGCVVDIAGYYSVKGDYDYSFWIHDNLVMLNPQALVAYNYTNPIEGEAQVEDVIINNNRFVNYTGTPAFNITNTMISGDPCQQKRVYIYNNLFENMGYADNTGWSYGFAFGSGYPGVVFEDFYIYNNTLTTHTVGKSLAAMCFALYDVTSGTIRNINFKNNIVAGFRDAPIYVYLNTGLIRDVYNEYNVLYDNGNNNQILYSGDASTIINYVNSNNIYLDPSFISVSSSDYHLLSNSPAIHAGIHITDISILTDYDGSLWNNPPTIGAYEYSYDASTPDASTSSPFVDTSIVSNISTTSASCAGIVTHDGSISLVYRGICISTNASPTYLDVSVRDTYTGEGAYTLSLTSLNSSTHYHVRAFAYNSQGTSYGIDVSFNTLSTPASVSTNVTFLKSGSNYVRYNGSYVAYITK